MTESKQSSHADGAAAPSQVPEPSLAERAKTLTVEGGPSSLATMSRKHPGFPFASVMPYGLTELGEPILLISSMAMHTQNLLAEPRATLLITQQTDSPNPLGAARISLMGTVVAVDDEAKLEDLGQRYLERNPDAKHWMHYGDFQFFQMTLRDIYFIGGFGVMGWIGCDQFLAAQPDPLAPFAAGIIQHMNEDHREAMVLMAKYYRQLDAEDAEMTAVDRLGFHLRVRTAEGMKGTRIAFPAAIASNDQVRGAMKQLVQAARQ